MRPLRRGMIGVGQHTSCMCVRVEWGLDAPVQKALRMWDKDALQDVNLQHHSRNAATSLTTINIAGVL